MSFYLISDLFCKFGQEDRFIYVGYTLNTPQNKNNLLNYITIKALPKGLDIIPFIVK
jgi:hypothetical protein